MNDEITYKLFKTIAQKEVSGQRQLAKEVGVSLGKLNYCIKELFKKGLVKATNFYNSDNKKSYIYKLTPEGVTEKAKVTARFLEYKLKEYEKIQKEIIELQLEVEKSL